MNIVEVCVCPQNPDNKSFLNDGYETMDLDDVTDGLVAKVTSASRGFFENTSGGVVVTREAALDLWTRMTQLPVGKGARCHMPRYGLSLGHHGGYHWFATICWKCNNIYMSCDNVELFQQFDGQSLEARKLLSEIQSRLEDHSTGIS